MASSVNQMLTFLFPRLQALAATERTRRLREVVPAGGASAQADLDLVRQIRREVMSRRTANGDPGARQSTLYEIAARHGMTKDPEFKTKWSFIPSSRR